MDCRATCHFTQDFWWGLVWGGAFVLEVMGFGFPIQNVGAMDFPSPEARFYRHVALSKVRHIFGPTIS